MQTGIGGVNRRRPPNGRRLTLAPYVRILGRGPGRARALTETEAVEAMRLILAGESATDAEEALLMMMS